MNILIAEIKKFSKENWWVYLLFIGALGLVAYTGKGNLIEIIILFLANFLGNIFVMAMQNSFSENKPKIGTFFQVGSTLVFFFIGIYGLIYLGQSQYILWQIAYFLSAIKTFFYFNKKKDLKIINTKLLIFINIILLTIFSFYFIDFKNINLILIGSLILAIGFSFSSTGFVMLDDKKRYFTILTGTWLIIFGSLLLTYNSYLSGKIDGIALGYFILTGTVGIYFLKLLKKYLKYNN